MIDVSGAVVSGPVLVLTFATKPSQLPPGRVGWKAPVVVASPAVFFDVPAM